MSVRPKEGFTKADTTNLPEINPFMVYEFLTTDERFNAPEVRGKKLTLQVFFYVIFHLQKFIISNKI